MDQLSPPPSVPELDVGQSHETHSETFIQASDGILRTGGSLGHSSLTGSKVPCEKGSHDRTMLTRFGASACGEELFETVTAVVEISKEQLRG